MEPMMRPVDPEAGAVNVYVIILQELYRRTINIW